jgi:DNA-binding transcriptional LysR family regulator
MDLNALHDFVAVALHGGFAPAGRARNLPKSSLSRRVRELEEELGVRLLDRASRTFRLTTEGVELYERAAQLLEELDETEASLRSQSTMPSGQLRIAVPTLFGNLFVGRIAARYYAAFPNVALEIVASDRTVDIVAEGFDAAVRVNAQDADGLVKRRFSICNMLLVASPHLEQAPPKLGAHGHVELPTVICEAVPVKPPWQFIRGKRRFEVRPRPIMRLSALAMVRDAVLDGAGYALLPDQLVNDDIASGALTLCGSLYGHTVDLSIVHPSARLVSRRLRAFIDLLVASFPNGRKPLPGAVLPETAKSARAG